MKLLLLSFSFFLSFTAVFGSSSTKMIGIELGPSWGYKNLNSRFVISPRGGLNFQLELHKKISLKTGINYFSTRLDQGSYCDLTFDNELCYSSSHVNFDLIELPINFYFNLNQSLEASTHFFVFIGYSIAQVVRESYFFNYDNIPSGKTTFATGLLKTAHFFNLGFDVRQALSEKIFLFVGGGFKQTAMYYDRYGTTRSLQINLRLMKKL